MAGCRKELRSERVVHDRADALGNHVEENIDDAGFWVVPLDLEGEG
jgi:hypothetical protein